MARSLRDIISRHIGPPVNIEGIVRSLGVQLDKNAKLDGEISGQLERLPDGEFKISVNQKDHYFRRRFTIAHELGHFLYHGNLIGPGVDDNKAYRSVPDGAFYNLNIGAKEETEANRFAASVLMPKSKIIELAAVGVSVKDLAQQFQVSPSAMEIRLRSLGFLLENGVVEAEPVA